MDPAEPTCPRCRRAAATFRLLTGASTNNLSSGYPKNYVGPDGLVFGLANKAMYRVNPAGNGTITSLGTFPTDNAGGTSTAVMFAPGRILQVGGGNANAASRNASIININGATPQVTPLPQAQFGRHWGNATVMADGRVFVSGGSAVNNAATGVAYTSEIFDPATNTWSTGPTATRMRLYHSTSVLLPDATVITMGGGTPGPETNLNAEIYYPPYLFAIGRDRGAATDDHQRDVDRRSRRDPVDRDARCRLDRQGDVRQARFGDPLVRHGPAVHAAAVHPFRLDAAGDAADERLRDPARLLHAVRRQR